MLKKSFIVTETYKTQILRVILSFGPDRINLNQPVIPYIKILNSDSRIINYDS